jgi:hypothetical protein
MSEDALLNLRSLKYSEVEARFLLLVALHSGLFLRRQFHAFAGIESGKQTKLLADKLIRRRHATLYAMANRSSIYHLSSKAIYKAIGHPDLRHRRFHGVDYVKTKQLQRDYVLENSDCEYLPTEEEKVSFFTRVLGIPIEDLPFREYKTPQSKTVTRRYFVEKYPITFRSCAPPVVPWELRFYYVDPGFYRSSIDFLNFLRAYARLFAHFKEIRLVYIHRDSGKIPEAERMFHSFVSEESEGEGLERYFILHQLWDQGRFAEMCPQPLRDYTLLKRKFAATVYQNLYERWLQGAMPAAFLANENQRNWLFEPYKIRQSYAIFGDLE